MKSTVGSKAIKMKRGDTIVGVIFAVTVFSMVSVMTLALMNRGLATTQASLELTLARQELNAQAEALRFIHSAREEELFLDVENNPAVSIYSPLWRRIHERATASGNITNFNNIANQTSCMGDNGQLGNAPTSRRFVLNTRDINPANIDGTVWTGDFVASQLFPRLVYTAEANNADIVDGNRIATPTDTNIAGSEGIWIEAIRRNDNNARGVIDFHIRACWHAPGQATVSTLGTIVRLRDI